MTKNRILTIKRGEVQRLADTFGVTRATVWNALCGNYVTSPKNDRIRKAALNNGAIEVNMPSGWQALKELQLWPK